MTVEQPSEPRESATSFKWVIIAGVGVWVLGALVGLFAWFL
ncbi:MAG: hypothetical protein JWO38_4697 [Gemmataceae bacterium]|nr:hypothetical protein [Gemmataceae bacterium]